MKLWNRSGMLAMAVVAAACSASAQEWEPLVKGDSLDGWTQRGGNATYEVKDGVVIGRTAPAQKENAFLCTDQTWSDFELEMEFKVDEGLNSGVQVRSNSDPAYKKGRVHGYQVEIDPSPRNFTGAIYDEARRAVFLKDLKDNEPARSAFKHGEWNKMYISCRGDIMKTKINGVDAVTVNDSMTSSGFIALQVHGVKTTAPLEVRWRNIRIKDWDKVAITKWESDSPFGDYEGKFADGSPLVAQVTDLGDGRFHASFMTGFETTGSKIGEADGRAETTGTVGFKGDAISGIIDNKTFTGTRADGVAFDLKPVKRWSPTLGAKAPEGATVLFDGSSLNEWQKADGSPVGWKIAENATMQIVPKTGTIETKKQFGDMELHLEFRTSLMPYARGQQRSNSGVYLQGSYEVQVLDSYSLPLADNECGGIYKVGTPKLNMSFPPLQWQTYDISFTAARWDGDKKTENARISVKHNGFLIQDNVELPDATGGAKYKGEPNHPAPLQLQEHGNEVQFQNIWVAQK